MLWSYYILTSWLCWHKQLLVLAAQHQSRQVLAWTPRVKIGRQRDVERATRGISENNTLISRHTKIFFLGKNLAVPFPDFSANAPSQWGVWINIIACLLILLLLDLVPSKFMPIAYLIRASILIQISASIYFIIKKNEPNSNSLFLKL